MSQYWPKEVIEGRIATKNRYGFMFTEIDGASLQFIKDCESYHGTVVDIGCAYGVATLPVLENCDANIIAIDLSLEHLEILRQAAPSDKSEKLKTVMGRFPEDIEFEDSSIDAMHSSHVFHFVNGVETEKALAKILGALKPCGKLYINTASIYFPPVSPFLSEYEDRVNRGERWPGEIYDLQKFVPQEDLPYVPDFFNVYKISEFENLLITAGFTVEKIFYHDPKNQKLLASGGRAVIAAIVSKRK